MSTAERSAGPPQASSAPSGGSAAHEVASVGAMLLGCIADDFTGATDLANNLVRAGMRVVQAIGVPGQALDTDADAVVVALKSRTLPKSRKRWLCSNSNFPPPAIGGHGEWNAAVVPEKTSTVNSL
jgi:hypothetical protein